MPCRVRAGVLVLSRIGYAVLPQPAGLAVVPGR